MTKGQIKFERPDSQAVRCRFDGLPEKHKRALAGVVAGIVQTQGKLAAQRWLEKRLSTPLVKEDNVGQLQLGEALSGSSDGGHERLVQLAHDVDELTPRREALLAQAPTTVTDLSPEARVYEGFVAKAEPFTRHQLALIGSKLTPQSRKVLEFLHLYACSHAHSRNQSLEAQQISFFLPAETIRLSTGVPERTVYDALKRLKALGLVDHRGHVTTLPGFGNRCDGTIFAVKLDVLKSGEARVMWDDLVVSDYRDLAADIDAGRTVYRLAQSTWVGNLRSFFCLLLSWIESKCTVLWNIEVVKPRSLTVQASSSNGLEAVLEVTTGAVANRGQRIGAAASAVARAFGDQHSLAFWWKFCDALAGLVERGGRDYAPMMMVAMQREVAAKQEGFARCPAALFIARLKMSGVYGEIMTA